jgi:hypothetical protein
MIFRASRQPREDRFLTHRIVLFLIGSAFGVAGMARDNRWLVYTAIAIFASAAILGILSRPAPPPDEDEDDSQSSSK